MEMCRTCMDAAKSNDPIAIELQANDRALRKVNFGLSMKLAGVRQAHKSGGQIMDLEISNTSLLAVNTSLETTIRKQSQLIEQMRHEIAR